MQSLELFSGTAPFSAVMSAKGYETISVDIDQNFNPTYPISILDFDYKQPGIAPAVIWASVLCKDFSRAANQKHFKKEIISKRNYKYTAQSESAAMSVKLLDKTIEIIKNFQDCTFFIENPVGRLPHFPSMRNLGHYRYSVNYKDFGFDYSKETYIFTNLLLSLPTTRQIRHGRGLRSVNNRTQRSIVPIPLIEFLTKDL